MLSFKDFMVVDYTPGMPDLVSYAAHKRHRGRIGEEVETEEVETEALNFAQRRNRARIMKKNKAKIAMGQRRAKRKPANTERLTKRAQRTARMALFKRLSKGKSKSEVPAARRQEIEKRLDKMKGRIQKLARRMLPDVRKKEKERRMSKGDE